MNTETRLSKYVRPVHSTIALLAGIGYVFYTLHIGREPDAIMLGFFLGPSGLYFGLRTSEKNRKKAEP